MSQSTIRQIFVKVINIDSKLVFAAMYVPWILGSIIKTISFADVMSHVREIAPKAIEAEKSNKDVIGEIGSDLLNREVRF